MPAIGSPASSSPPITNHFDHGDSFYDRHPELRGTARSGEATPRLSHAYAETRRFAVDLLREVASTYDVDGVSLAYNRRPPLVEYEPPVVGGFKAELGLDPFDLDPADRRWLAYRAGVLTGFMQEVRAAMDSLAREQGRRRISVSAIVMASEEETCRWAWTCRPGSSRGLIDTIIPYTSAPALDSTQDSWIDPQDGAWFGVDHRGDRMRGRLQPPAPADERGDLPPASGGAVRHRRRAVRVLGLHAGAPRATAQPWSALRRLGHRDEVLAWAGAASRSWAWGRCRVEEAGGLGSVVRHAGMTALPEQAGASTVTIVAFGDSMTAPRPGQVQRVYGERLVDELDALGIHATV